MFYFNVQSLMISRIPVSIILGLSEDWIIIVCDRKIYGRNNGRYYGRKAYGRNVSAIILFRSHRSFKMSYIEAKSIKIWLSY